jgi:hypothetical protein
LATRYRVYYWILDGDGRPKLRHKDFSDEVTAMKFFFDQKSANRQLFGTDETVWLETSR